MGDATSGPLTPIGHTERIETLDVVRGFALLGILLMNIVAMGLPFAAYFNPQALGPASQADLTAWFLTNTFVEGSMRTLFSMLFGAGFVLLLERLDARGAGLAGARTYMRRVVLLMALGLVDMALFLWFGDILFAYGLAGVLLLVFYKAKLRSLVFAALLLFGLTALFNLGAGAQVASMQEAHDKAVAAREQGQTLTEEQSEAIRTWQDVSAFWSPSEEELKETRERVRDGWGAVGGHNLGKLFGQEIGFFVIFNLIDLLAAMLLGMIAFRLGLMQGRWPLWGAAALALGGFAIGVPVNLMETRAVIDSGFSIQGFLAMMRTYDLGRVSLAAGWLGLILLVCKTPLLGCIRAGLGAVGRMALSNYLLHSIMAAILFVGFGFFERFGRAELYGIVAGFWAINLLFSLVWLRFFSMGPFEWLWRAGTYGAWAPIRRARSGADAGA